MNLSHMVKKLEKQKEKQGVKEESTYLMDKGYFNPAEMPCLKKEGKKIYIAPPIHFTEHWFITGEHDAVIEEEKVYFICRSGKKKKGVFRKKNNNYEFPLKRAVCEGCENFSSCWKGKNKVKVRTFTISKNYIDNEQFWRRYHEKTQSMEWTQIYNKRIGKEHNFYDLKSNNGFNRISWRGKRKANTVSVIAGISYNLKKFQKVVIDMGWEGINKYLGGGS